MEKESLQKKGKKTDQDDFPCKDLCEHLALGKEQSSLVGKESSTCETLHKGCGWGRSHSGIFLARTAPSETASGGNGAGDGPLTAQDCFRSPC